MKIIEWMVKNPVAANVLLFVIVIGGLFTATTLDQEVFPTIELDIITVTVVYPGAGPSEVANSLCIPLEEAVNNLTGIEEMLCLAKENTALLTLTLEKGVDLDERLQETRNAVSQILDFPPDIEVPTVSKVIRERQVLSLALSGDVDDASLYQVGKRIMDELGKVSAVSRVTTSGLYAREMSIEVRPEVLSRQGLTLRELATIVGASSTDLPAGTIQTKEGELLLRSLSKKSTPKEFSEIVVRGDQTGSKVLLGDIANIEEKSIETQNFVLFDGHKSIFFNLYQKEGFTPKQALNQVQDYLDQAKLTLPRDLKLVIWEDRSEIFSQRFDLLMRNGLMGLTLVFVVLALFLEIHLAFWVMLGIPISFAGSLMLMPLGDVSLNMISMMAFILVLGIVVDDAIVVGENVFQKIEEGMDRMSAATEGAKEMGPAVFFAVATTCLAFGPLALIEGGMGRFMFAVPVIIISVLAISLIEALIILPAHLAKEVKPSNNPIFKALEDLRHFCDSWLNGITKGRYTKTLVWTLNNKATSLSLALVSLMLTVSLVVSGLLPMQFFPSIESDEVQFAAELPSGYPGYKAKSILVDIVKKGEGLIAKADAKADNGVNSLEHTYVEFVANSQGGTSTVNVKLRLKDGDTRNVSVFDLGRNWRKAIGNMPEVKNMSFKSRGMHFGDDISLAMTHADQDTLSAAIAETKEYFGDFSGVTDIADSEKEGKSELRFSLLPEANNLGISPKTFANSLRAAFNGVKVGNLLKDKTSMEVVVRYPASERNNLSNLEKLRIRNAKGGEITLGEAASLSFAIEPTSIRRENRERVVVVTAKIMDSITEPDAITDEIAEKWVPLIMAKYPGLKIEKTGRGKDRAKSMQGLIYGFFGAQFFIYALLAVFFKSYFQPLIVMAAIPFGIAGAAIGHLLLGYPLSFLSMFGLVGLSGVVVNDSLILLDAINRHPLQKIDLFQAVIEASQSRVRPILMTTVTTFFGLMPLLLETSRQAKFLVPMAISLGVGIVFATLITLLLIPLFFMIQQKLLNQGAVTEQINQP
ncbi:MAG: efflux RND transporter permease subunit [SAR324 cluster bacterium]|nr:efflux RND transporter permease subunit [SAR324 cluster bacterium]